VIAARRNVARSFPKCAVCRRTLTPKQAAESPVCPSCMLEHRRAMARNPGRSRAAIGQRIELLLTPRVPGVFQIVKVLGAGRFHVRRADGLTMNVPAGAMRPVKNPKLHSVVYEEQKSDDDRPYLYEHEFEGTKPNLEWRGRTFRISRGGSRFTVRKDARGDKWIHG